MVCRGALWAIYFLFLQEQIKGIIICQAMTCAESSSKKGEHLLRKSMPATKDFTTNDLSILRIGPFSPAKRTAHCLSQLSTVSTPLARLSPLDASHSTHHKTTVTMATCVFNVGTGWASAQGETCSAPADIL